MSRCFSFGIGEGASTALINGLAQEGSGHAQFITGTDRMQPKVGGDGTCVQTTGVDKERQRERDSFTTEGVIVLNKDSTLNELKDWWVMW